MLARARIPTTALSARDDECALKFAISHATCAVTLLVLVCAIVLDVSLLQWTLLELLVLGLERFCANFDGVYC